MEPNKKKKLFVKVPPVKQDMLLEPKQIRKPVDVLPLEKVLIYKMLR